MKKIRRLLIIALAIALVPLGFANAEDEKEDATEGASTSVHYVEFSPGIIANYGSEKGKPKLLNAEVTLQITDEDMADQIRKYLIPARHDLIMLFSNLKSDEANSGEQVEALRAKALETVHATLGEWIKDVQVADLLFTKFVTE